MQAWENFLQLQENELGVDVVQNWLRTLKVLQFDACNLYLEASDAFQINWFEEHIRKRANQVLTNNNNKKIKIHLLLEGSTPPSKPKKISRKKNEEPQNPVKFSIAFDELDQNLNFDSFVVNEANTFAYKLFSKTIGYNSETKSSNQEHALLNAYNPIFIHGPAGCGKTHLLMAAAHNLRSYGMNVIYTRAETFTEHVVTAITAGEMRQFRQSYRNADVLIIDDVHLFSRKTATQEELFHTFNTLHVSGKQIILSANCTPSELTYIEPRLVSRFEWGIVVPMESTAQNSLKQIIQAKTDILNFSIPATIVDLLVELFPSGCKAIIRALEALMLRTHMSGKGESLNEFSAPLVKKLLADLIEEEQRAAITPEKILQQVTEFFGIPQEEVVGKSQSRECALPRQIAMYFCRTELEMPYTRIGDLFGRDHSTVMSSIKLVHKGIEKKDPNITIAIHTLQKKLKV